MPGILADEYRGSAPRRVERPHLVTPFDETLLVEQPVRREKILPVDVQDFRLAVAESDVGSAVVERVAPLLVKPDYDIHRTWRRDCCAKRGVEVPSKLSGRDGEISNGAFNEVAAHGRLGKLHDLRSRLECVGTRQDVADARDVGCVVALARSQ